MGYSASVGRSNLDGHKKVQWQGNVEIKASGTYQFHLHVKGIATLTVNNKPIITGRSDKGEWFASESIELPFGSYAATLEVKPIGSSGSIGLYWQGPGYGLEPITDRYLTHATKDTSRDAYERGQLLARALRCSACHDVHDATTVMASPDLAHVAENVRPEWLYQWLTEKPTTESSNASELANDRVHRRMPHFALDQQQALDVIAALWDQSKPLPSMKQTTKNEKATSGGDKKEKSSDKSKDKDKGKASERKEPDAAFGALHVASRGCTACHSDSKLGIGVIDEEDEAAYLPHNRLSSLGRDLFDGGDLANIANKRPDSFFVQWLKDSRAINPTSRMPQPELSDLEVNDIALYLKTRKSSEAIAPIPANLLTGGDVSRGLKLIESLRCRSCHTSSDTSKGSSSKTETPRLALTGSSNWQTNCLDQPDPKKNIPGFGLTSQQRGELKTYFASVAKSEPSRKTDQAEKSLSNRQIAMSLVENNCTGCHARDWESGNLKRAMQAIAHQPDLAPKLAALLPPALSGVGDKLKDQALIDSIRRKGTARRPWLEVRMPHYQFPELQLDQLVSHLVASDRIPERQLPAKEHVDDLATRAAVGRLVTSDGFGCQSCHQIGSQLPPTVALNARGTDLTMLGDRVRQQWFDRWVRNPVRIVSRMEMPAIQTPVKGVLNSNLDKQLDAVWDMLNTKGFEPPAAAPVRIVRNHNRVGVAEPAHVLTDVLETPQQKYIRPLIVGLDNRHNVLFDLERAELSQWWIGDVARELTRGKSWYWEMGGQSLLDKSSGLLQFGLQNRQGTEATIDESIQFPVRFDALSHTKRGILWNGRFQWKLDRESVTVPFEMACEPWQGNSSSSTSESSGAQWVVRANVPKQQTLVLHCSSLPEVSKNHEFKVRIDARSELTLVASRGVIEKGQKTDLVLSPDDQGMLEFSIRLATTWPVDEFIKPDVATTASINTGTPNANTSASASAVPVKPIELKTLPGFEVTQLPLPRSEMPTALAWHNGQLAIGSLKGQVSLAVDTDHDGLPDQWQPISDDLPAPYGLASNGDSIDVLAKFGLIRLTPSESKELPWKMQTVADGWGHTADYHDWAVGLVRDARGNYFVALPCQQDDRTPAAANLRGTIQQLVPQSPTSQDPRRYRLETFSAGQRFPMGLAMNRAGDLFSTDNQGNYNPFNELNHLQRGKRYGFINKLENKPGFNPPLESPAINVPHPWTRSVNGICFLDTPDTASTKNRFGPFEGHLVGCEYNGLSLIRMSLQLVDGQYQGAAYLFSQPVKEGEQTFEGPVVCAISPDGNLYVGNLHDSGWGGGQNTGSITRCIPTTAWPLGIREVTATKDGLNISFTQPIDPALARRTEMYTIRSYRRISTPAYGGSDQDERQEQVVQAVVAQNAASVMLKLDNLREDSVYEVQVGAVAGDQSPLFPYEAHYTMKRVPK